MSVSQNAPLQPFGLNLSAPDPSAAEGRAYRALKRTMDVAVCIAAMPILVPLFAATAVAIKLDSSGPVFFRQYRYGQHGKPFRIFKFRSMRTESCSATGGAQAGKDDPRVTRVGRFLRKTSIDELPQVLNILLGEMSWVGPRPHAVEHDHFYAREIPYYVHRFAAKPGLTGWAQVNGFRGETKKIEQMSSRVRYDLDYIRKQNLLMDVQIIFLTFGVLLHPNAY